MIINRGFVSITRDQHRIAELVLAELINRATAAITDGIKLGWTGEGDKRVRQLALDTLTQLRDYFPEMDYYREDNEHGVLNPDRPEGVIGAPVNSEFRDAT